MDWNKDTKGKPIKNARRSPRGNVDWNSRHNVHSVSYLVVPHAGTWIEIALQYTLLQGPQSFPTRERGLKYDLNLDWLLEEWVVPHAGTWIEIVRTGVAQAAGDVVPHAGTWIEMRKKLMRFTNSASFPTRERGLKSCGCDRRRTGWSRSPRGNVDWNYVTYEDPLQGRWSFPTWERGLKFYRKFWHFSRMRRSPHGNVDWNYTDLNFSRYDKKSFPTRECGLK